MQFSASSNAVQAWSPAMQTWLSRPARRAISCPSIAITSESARRVASTAGSISAPLERSSCTSPSLLKSRSSTSAASTSQGAPAAPKSERAASSSGSAGTEAAAGSRRPKATAGAASIDQGLAQRDRHGLRARVALQLRHGVLHVRAHGERRDRERAPRLLVAHPLGSRRRTSRSRLVSVSKRSFDAGPASTPASAASM